MKIVTVLNIILCMLILASGGYIARSIIAAVHNKNLRPVASSALPNIKPVTESFPQYETLLQKNPFGITAVSAKGASVEAPETVFSDLKLMGTIAGSRKRGYAVFVGKDGKQTLCKTGELVGTTGKLTAVEKNQVSISSNGKVIKINLVDTLAPGEINSLKDGGASGSVQSLGPGEYIIDSKALLHALDNPTQIMMDAKLIPNVTNDKQEGFVLREVRKSSIYDNLGMQNGDILLRVNSFSLSDPETALQAFMALRGMEKIQLDIIRDKKRMVMNYQVK